ncbi:MAG: TetR/AcrR family transcriptional regulator [Syntrophomonas sp.]
MNNDIHPTKYAILEAAIKVFGDKGFNGATTKEIAQIANIAEGTVFRHFTNKAEILYTIVDYFMPLIGVDSLEQTLSECQEMDKETALRHIIQNRFETILGNKDLIKIILTEIQYDLTLRETYYERVFKPIQQMLSDFFNARIGKGDLREVNPRLISTLVLSFIVFFVGNQNYSDNVLEYQFDADDLTDILLNGIKGNEQHE